MSFKTFALFVGSGVVAGALVGCAWKKAPKKGAMIGAAAGLVGATIASTRETPPALPSRASCKECVTKHLGSAAVLIGEINDGYPEHRLLAIGNMREAEEESQAWPALHNAIRDARKRYMQEGVIPNWAALSTAVAAVS